MKRKTLTALALAVGLAACGGDDKLSKSAFIAQADKICADYDKKGDAIDAPESADGVKAYVDEAKPVLEDQISELKALEDRAPDSVSADYSEAMNLLDEQAALFDDLGSASGDEQKIRDLSEEGQKLSTQSDELAAKIGLKECGSSS